MSAVNLNNLSINELKKLVKEEFNKNKLIEVYQKLQKQNSKLRKEKN